MKRLVFVVEIMLREDAHPELVERTLFQSPKGLLLKLQWLVNPGIAGGAKREIRGAVGVDESRPIRTCRSVVFGGGYGARKSADTIVRKESPPS